MTSQTHTQGPTDAGLTARVLSSEWKTMESAPKDGTEIIAYRPDQGVFTCRWSTMEELVDHDINGDPIEEYNENQEDWWHDRWGWLELDCAPTHWMPLPTPPTNPKGAA